MASGGGVGSRGKGGQRRGGIIVHITSTFYSFSIYHVLELNWRAEFGQGGGKEENRACTAFASYARCIYVCVMCALLGEERRGEVGTRGGGDLHILGCKGARWLGEQDEGRGVPVNACTSAWKAAVSTAVKY